MLWGRSGNRCGICKLEVTPDGESITIGEMAHIVSRSVDGPRGRSDLSTEDRDQYGNLILLCPNHHAEIDKSPEKWPVEVLRKIKEEHERWVSERLDKGLIFVTPIDNSKFLEDRLKSWIDFAKGAVWVAVSITPLRLGGDSLNPLDPELIEIFNNLIVPYDQRTAKSFNRRNTRPNESGLINDDLQYVDRGYGYRIQAFRNGNCEFLLSIEASMQQVSSYPSRWRDEGFEVEGRMIRYTDLARAVKVGVDSLWAIWTRLLPFKDMTLRVCVLNTAHCSLFSYETAWGEPVRGYPVESENLLISAVIGRNEPPTGIFESTIKQLANYFGLVLNQVWEETGALTRPERLVTGT